MGASNSRRFLGVLLALATVLSACGAVGEQPGAESAEESGSPWDEPDRLCESLEGPYRARYDHRQFVVTGGTVGAGYNAQRLGQFYDSLRTFSPQPDLPFAMHSLRDFIRADRAFVGHFKGGTPVSDDVAELEANAAEVHTWVAANCDNIAAEHVDTRPAVEVLAAIDQ